LTRLIIHDIIEKRTDRENNIENTIKIKGEVSMNAIMLDVYDTKVLNGYIECIESLKTQGVPNNFAIGGLRLVTNEKSGLIFLINEDIDVIMFKNGEFRDINKDIERVYGKVCTDDCDCDTYGTETGCNCEEREIERFVDFLRETARLNSLV
jgi:hypothetical protein